MVWSKWKGGAVLAGLGGIGLICASLVYSQQTAPRPSTPATDPSLIVTIQEAGKPPMECLILKTYRQADGQMAHDLRILATGETMTVVGDTSMDSKAKTSALPANKSKAGMPTSSVQEQVVSGPQTTPAARIQPVPVEEYRTLQESWAKPAMEIARSWRHGKWLMATRPVSCKRSRPRRCSRLSRRDPPRQRPPAEPRQWRHASITGAATRRRLPACQCRRGRLPRWQLINPS